jgi:ABC-type cobalamin/Fe3+-siderophores transport system ATPase subunit
MITSITGIGFKGLDFDHHIEPLMIFLGPNGSGKSARTLAAILALNGYIPGSAKTNAAILETYGSGDKLVAGVKIDGKHFERGFVRTEDGKVGQGFKVAGKKVAEKAFYMAMAEVCAPKAVDVSAFMELSAQKKIDAIFDLYPPKENLEKLTTDIEASRQKINNLTQKAKSSEEAAARITASQAEIVLPVGSYAELCAQIRETEKEVEGARKDLQDVELENAREKAVEDEKKRAEEAKRKAEEEARRKELEEAAKPLASFEPGPMEQEVDARFGTDKAQAALPADTVFSPIYVDSRPQFVDPIQTIINAINDAGCSACAARLVAVRELRKLEGGNNGSRP